jgi:hypothetical protein
MLYENYKVPLSWPFDAGVGGGSFFATNRKITSVRKVPFSASRYALLSVSYGDNRRSELNFQRPEFADAVEKLANLDV